MNPSLAAALRALIAEAPGRVWLTTGYRSNQHQTQLWEKALKKYGDPEIADNWVARPGTSHHETGDAGDIAFENAGVREWVHANAGRFGLRFPMGHEPWHIELAGQRNGADPRAYTRNPKTGENPVDALAAEMAAEDPYDPGIQARRLFELFQKGPGTTGADTSAGDSPEPEFTSNAGAVQEATV